MFTLICPLSLYDMISYFFVTEFIFVSLGIQVKEVLLYVCYTHLIPWTQE